MLVISYPDDKSLFSSTFLPFQRGHLPVNEAVLLQKVISPPNSQSTVQNNIKTTRGGPASGHLKQKVPILPPPTPKVAMTGSSAEGPGGPGSNGLLSAQVEVPDEKDARYCVLSYEQVKRLNDLMSEVINIHGRGNFPTIDVRLCDLVSVVKSKLESDGVKVHEIRLNGSGASSVLASSDLSINYNDLDLIFSVDLSTAKAFERVKATVLESLLELLPEGVSRKRMSSCSLKEAYVSKMVKVNDSGDRWSLISLGKLMFKKRGFLKVKTLFLYRKFYTINMC